MDWALILTFGFFGALAGLVVFGFIFLIKRWRFKRKILENIANQTNQDFIIPEKLENGKYEGESVDLMTYCGLEEEFDEEFTENEDISSDIDNSDSDSEPIIDSDEPEESKLPDESN